MSQHVPAGRARERFRWPAFLVATVEILLVGHSVAGAQTRDPTPAEQALVDRFSNVVGGVLDQFGSDDWTEKVTQTMEGASVAVKPDRPLQAGLLERSYEARRDSARWNTLIRPYADIVTGGKASPQDMAKAGKQMNSLMHVHVSATFNDRFSALNLAKDAEIKVAGAARVFLDAHPTRYDEPGVVLLFSGAGPGRWVNADGGLRFEFANPPGSVVIENIQIRISGAKDRIDQLLSRIDWRKIDGALGR